MHLDKVLILFRVELELFFLSDEYARSRHSSSINIARAAISLKNCIGTRHLETGSLRQVIKRLTSFFLSS